MVLFIVSNVQIVPLKSFFDLLSYNGLQCYTNIHISRDILLVHYYARRNLY